MKLLLAPVLLLAALAAAAPAVAQLPGRDGLIYFTSPSQTDASPDCGVGSVSVAGTGFSCIDRAGFDASVAPDHSLIALVASEDPLRIWSEALSGKRARPLTRVSAGDGGHPTFSPDGRRILYDVSASAAPGIYVMNADGSDPRRLTTGGFEPTISPGGGQIAYQAGGIAIANADGSGSHVVIADSNLSTNRATSPTTTEFDRTQTINDEPDWSPDGRQIAFTRTTRTAVSTCDDATFDCTPKASPLVRHVYVANADGSEVRQLTTGASMLESEPSWAPDGREVAFYAQPMRGPDGGGEIWIVRADGSRRRAVALGQFPDWSTVRTRVPARPRIKLTTVKLHPRRSCFDFFTDGFGASVTTHAAKATGFQIAFYIDGKVTDQVSDGRELSTGPHAVRRGRHRLKVVVSDFGVRDTVSRSVSFREC